MFCPRAIPSRGRADTSKQGVSAVRSRSLRQERAHILNGNQLEEVVKVYENIKASYSTMVNTAPQYIVDWRLELAKLKLESADKSTEIWKTNYEKLELQCKIQSLEAQLSSTHGN